MLDLQSADWLPFVKETTKASVEFRNAAQSLCSSSGSNVDRILILYSLETVLSWK